MTIKTINILECDYCHDPINEGEDVVVVISGQVGDVNSTDDRVSMRNRKDRDYHRICYSNYLYPTNTVKPSESRGNR